MAVAEAAAGARARRDSSRVPRTKRRARAAPVPRAAPASSSAGDASDANDEHAELKALLADLEALGRVRLIVNTGAFVLESCTTFEGLTYARGYANLMKDAENVDFHLKLEGVSAARFEKKRAPEKVGGYDMHFVRFMDMKGEEQLSVFVMWPEGAKRGAYAEGQAEAFEALHAKWGDKVQFQLIEGGHY